MADLVVGVVALAGLFNNAVECFEFVQLGRTLGKSFQTSQLKLDCARLRLSRWGKSLGLDEDIRETASLRERFEPKANVKHAEHLLGQILVLFAEAEGVSKKFSGLAVYNPQTDLGPVAAKLHEKMRQLAIERQNRSGIRQKAKWALFQEKQFRQLNDDITELLNGLDNLFPVTQQLERDLCDVEVSTIGDGKDGDGKDGGREVGNGGDRDGNGKGSKEGGSKEGGSNEEGSEEDNRDGDGDDEAMSVLREIAASQDKPLVQAITRATASAGKPHHHVVFSGSGNTGVQLGHNSGTMSGFTFGRDH